MSQVILAMFLFQSVNYIVIELEIALLAMWFFHTLEQKVEKDLLTLEVPRLGTTYRNIWNLHIH